jgi:hypothetical protein
VLRPYQSRLHRLTLAALATTCSIIATLGAGLVAVTVPSAFAATGAGPNLVTNGCISSGTAAPTYYSHTTLPGWTVSATPAHPVEVFAGFPGVQKPPGCPGGLDLSGPNSVSQAVSTTPGTRYLLDWEGNTYGCEGGTASMHVMWNGGLVASPVYKSICGVTKWAAGSVMVRATTASSMLEFAQASSNEDHALLSSVSLTLVPTVNGFVTVGLPAAYSQPIGQVLTKVPDVASVPGTGAAAACTLQADTASELGNGAGFELVWDVAPAAQFLAKAPTARLSAARAVEAYLTTLVKDSRDDYQAALQADRIPPATNDLAGTWAVRVQTVTTTGVPISFQVAETGTTLTFNWTGVPGVSVHSGSGPAPAALANLLYYSKAEGTTTAST